MLLVSADRQYYKHYITLYPCTATTVSAPYEVEYTHTQFVSTVRICLHSQDLSPQSSFVSTAVRIVSTANICLHSQDKSHLQTLYMCLFVGTYRQNMPYSAG